MSPKDGPGGLDARVHQILSRTVAFAALLAPDGRVVDVSENALEAAGIDLEDVRGKPFWEGFWFAHDPAIQERVRRAVEGAREGETSRFDYPARIRDEGRLTVDFQIAPILDERGRVAELIASGSDVTEREAAKARLEIALRDASHRLQNLLATVRALAQMTLVHAPPEGAIPGFLARLEALSQSHRALDGAGTGEAVPFEALASAVLEPFVEGREDRVRIRGGESPVRRDPAKMLGLCLHELATNAVKHGALASEAGTIEVELAGPDAWGRARFLWSEEDGPLDPQGTEGTGFGLSFLRSTMRHLFGEAPAITRGDGTFAIEVAGDAADFFAEWDPSVGPGESRSR